ncbi:MAG: UDP-N-acetylglucosamine--N-acetylmuramyl-(pentapeptide) pyrophosphoryl-undecaprenol N-acetylglucosamine transferase [Bacillales bacterium]|nr:UDP-N-acetylglucosamine--N-acetylmuramyl-(pentapeptide) pyrophosphoryl-undecaprenol N-acetylglucosamine transferase [Bacillales bacterium]
MKILLVASSSGGHVYPCISFGDYLKKNHHKVKYLGIKNQFEEDIYLQEGIYLGIENSFKKYLTHPNLQELLYLKKIIKEFDAIICFGGFITFLVTIANIFINRPLFIHEQNVVLGDANKIGSIFSKRVFTAFDIKIYKGMYVGNPRQEKCKKKEFSFKKKLRVLFVFGSLSSTTLLDIVCKYVNSINDNMHDYTIVISKKYYQIYTKKILNKRITLLSNIDLSKNYDNYDLIFSRAGASTLSEIIASRTYAVIIPSPYVKHNHQYKNALYLKKKGMIDVLLEKDFSLENINRFIELYSSDFSYVYNRYLRLSMYRLRNSNELMEKEILKYVKN